MRNILIGISWIALLSGCGGIPADKVNQQVKNDQIVKNNTPIVVASGKTNKRASVFDYEAELTELFPLQKPNESVPFGTIAYDYKIEFTLREHKYFYIYRYGEILNMLGVEPVSKEQSDFFLKLLKRPCIKKLDEAEEMIPEPEPSPFG